METTAVAPKTKMTLDELQTRPEWAALNHEQQEYVRGVASGLNFIDSAKRAYPRVQPENLRALIFRLDENLKVRAARDLLFGLSQFDRLILDLRRAASKSKGLAKIEALRTIAQMQGYLGGAENAGAAEAQGEPAAPESKSGANESEPPADSRAHTGRNPYGNW